MFAHAGKKNCQSEVRDQTMENLRGANLRTAAKRRKEEQAEKQLTKFAPGGGHNARERDSDQCWNSGCAKDASSERRTAQHADGAASASERTLPGRSSAPS